jgi:mannose-6-phosphate isomerase-like protein (cupin superfamily)
MFCGACSSKRRLAAIMGGQGTKNKQFLDCHIVRHGLANGVRDSLRSRPHRAANKIWETSMAAASDQPQSELRGVEKKESFFRATEENIQIFSMAEVDDAVDGRTNYRLCNGDVLRGTVQVLPPGFANSLHYHPAYEGFWMVLKGQVRFHGADEVIGEFGPMEGAYIPCNGRYWFEQMGEGAAQLLQVQGDPHNGSNKRVDIGQRHANYGKSRLIEKD